MTDVATRALPLNSWSVIARRSMASDTRRRNSTDFPHGAACILKARYFRFNSFTSRKAYCL